MNKKTLVLGVSLKPDRYSYMAVQRLVNHQFEVIAFGLKSGVVAGITIDTTLKIYENIHTVTLYVNPKAQKMLIDYTKDLWDKAAASVEENRDIIEKGERFINKIRRES